MKTIKEVSYKDEYGNPQSSTVGRNGVVKINEHRAQGDGDKWYYDILFDDGKIFRTFSPVFVCFNN